jgi:Domain of unknown function (DUF5664)
MAKKPIKTPKLLGENPKDAIGSKKVSISKVPPSAIIEMARAFENGAAKYGAYNYRETEVRASIYVDAAIRHLMCWFDGEQVADDSGVTHLGHALASIGILVDTTECGTLADDRPKQGTSSVMIERYRRK